MKLEYSNDFKRNYKVLICKLKLYIKNYLKNFNPFSNCTAIYIFLYE